MVVSGKERASNNGDVYMHVRDVHEGSVKLGKTPSGTALFTKICHQLNQQTDTLNILDIHLYQISVIHGLSPPRGTTESIEPMPVDWSQSLPAFRLTIQGMMKAGRDWLESNPCHTRHESEILLCLLLDCMGAYLHSFVCLSVCLILPLLSVCLPAHLTASCVFACVNILTNLLYVYASAFQDQLS